MRLLDVNVLLASVLEAHEHHATVARWMERKSKTQIATCALTETSLLRLLMNPVINEDPVDAETGLALLERLHQHPRHRFLKEGPSPRTPGAAKFLKQIRGYRQITDAWLVSLAAANGGKLATLDRKLEAVFGKDFVDVIQTK